MIKIPGTDAGLPAIEEAIYEGININVTLLFSVEAYAQGGGGVHPRARAPARGGQAARACTRWRASSSRASTPRWTSGSRSSAAPSSRAPPPWRTRGPPTRRFKEIFYGERFAKLRDAGAPVQRPLWASTGVKNPHYPETMYVDDAGGPDTVNTMPMPTLLAVAERGEVKGATADIDPTDDAASSWPTPASTWTT